MRNTSICHAYYVAYFPLLTLLLPSLCLQQDFYIDLIPVAQNLKLLEYHQRITAFFFFFLPYMTHRVLLPAPLQTAAVERYYFQAVKQSASALFWATFMWIKAAFKYMYIAPRSTQVAGNPAHTSGFTWSLQSYTSVFATLIGSLCANSCISLSCVTWPCIDMVPPFHWNWKLTSIELSRMWFVPSHKTVCDFCRIMDTKHL